MSSITNFFEKLINTIFIKKLFLFLSQIITVNSCKYKNIFIIQILYNFEMSYMKYFIKILNIIINNSISKKKNLR